MYVVSNLLSRIGSLLRVATPEDNDAVLRIPNTVLEPIPYPHSFPSNGGTLFTDSFTIIGQSTITNTGGGFAASLCQMVPGVWRLTCGIDSEFNWLNANPLATDNFLFLRQGAANDIALWFSAARVSRVVLDLNPRTHTFAAQTDLRLNQNGNGVGQTSTFNVVVHAVRLL